MAKTTLAFLLLLGFSVSAYAQSASSSIRPNPGTYSVAVASDPDPVQSGLTAYWKMDENTGITADDSIGSFDGTLTNGPTGVTGKSGSAVSFSSQSSHYIAIANPSPIGNSTTFSLSLWFKSTTAEANTGKLYSEGSNISNNPLWCVSMNEDSAGDISFSYKDNSDVAGSSSSLATAASNNGAWHHVVLVQTSKSLRELYYDNIKLLTNTTTVGALTLNTANIGRFERIAVTNYFSGQIDQVRLYDGYALSVAEINSIYTAGK